MKNYFETISTHGAKSKRVALRQDLKTRESSLSELVNMILTEAGSIKTRWGTEQYARVIVADDLTKFSYRFIDLAGTIYLLCYSDGTYAYKLTNLNGEDVDTIANDVLVDIDLTENHLGNRARWFNIRANHYFSYRIPNADIPNEGGKAFYVDTADTLETSVPISSADYGGKAASPYVLFGNGLEYDGVAHWKYVGVVQSATAPVYYDGTTYWQVTLDDAQFTGNIDRELEVALRNSFLYISVYHGGTYNKWCWWKIKCDLVNDNGSTWVFRSNTLEPELVFDDNGTNPSTMGEDIAYTNGGNHCTVFFSFCPYLSEYPNHVTSYNDRVVLIYDHWIVGGVVGYGLAFDSRLASDIYSFALELRAEFGSMKWALGREGSIVIGTTRGIYKIDTSSGFAASTIGAPYQQSSTPVADIEPAWFGDYILFVGADKQNIYEISYSNEQQNYITRSITADFDFPIDVEIVQIVSAHLSSNYLFAITNDGRVFLYSAAADRVTFGWCEISFRGHCDYITVFDNKIYFSIKNGDQIYILTTIESEIRYEQVTDIDENDVQSVGDKGVSWEAPLDAIERFAGPVELTGYFGAANKLESAIEDDPIQLWIETADGFSNDDRIVFSDQDQILNSNFRDLIFTLKNGTVDGSDTKFDIYDEAGTTQYLYAAGETVDDWSPELGWMTEAQSGALPYQDWFSEDFLNTGDNAKFSDFVVVLYRYRSEGEWVEDTSATTSAVTSTGIVTPSVYAKDFLVGIRMPNPHAITMRVPQALFDRFRISALDLAMFETQTVMLGNDESDALEIELSDEVVLDTAPERFTGVKRIAIDQSFERMGEIWIGTTDPKEVEIMGARYLVDGEEE